MDISSVKFTKDEGTITVMVEKKEKEKEELNNNAQQVIVSIKDTGEGIDPRIRPKLFSRFATNSSQGTGLGLYISKSVVEAHGGRMWADDNIDRRHGATFYFSLPVLDIQADHPQINRK